MLKWSELISAGDNAVRHSEVLKLEWKVRNILKSVRFVIKSVPTYSKGMSFSNSICIIMYCKIHRIPTPF